MSYSEILYEVRNRVATLTLNRPEKRNALTPTLIRELTSALERAEQDPAVKLIVLQGAGKAFCSGLDLDMLGRIARNGAMENLYDSETLARLFKKIYANKKLTLAKVQGVAVAGGCGIATSADIVVADSETARFGYTETRIGFVPAIVAVLILRKTRHAGVRELLLRGNIVSADEALRLGMINYSIPSANFEKFTSDLIEELLTSVSATSIELTKKLLAATETMSLDDAIEFALSLNAFSRSTDDLKKGVGAFLNKEKLQW
ncbi:MAG: enoyl-CoA hydratase-related protein [Chloroherpetonaceae bacterium]|nr:enoyl-CoA hydratase-related protein [Chloroherpetonaceae bacterium]MDW8436976.1 enoyl-CoA hydratase-related protein [Chloroherpetonaceae bacterium]